MNTLPYNNIRRINGAAWHRSARLSLVDRIGGEWGTIFNEDRLGNVRAYTIQELLDLAGWSNVDFLKCDIEGAELELFSDPEAFCWIQRAAILALETHDRFKPGSTAAVEAALLPEFFDRHQSGEFLVFLNKRQTANSTACTSTASFEPIDLMPSAGRIRRFDLANVSREAWGIQAIDEDVFQLHPNPPGQPAAEVTFAAQLQGQREFCTSCRLYGGAAGSVIFSFRLTSEKQNSVNERLVLAPGETKDWTTVFPPVEGQCTITLATEMAPGAISNSHAWAQWKRPLLKRTLRQ